MDFRVTALSEYKLYLRQQLKQYIKDKKKLDVAVEELYQAFLDGVNFGRGRLEVAIH